MMLSVHPCQLELDRVQKNGVVEGPCEDRLKSVEPRGRKKQWI